ncbi:site-specific DNA-methyltransferase [Telluria beijingensis]|uniref:site-specific DNA-methyltransferase n=1 Tax=Telluria beijingensis TaxID=3068633 RepID=UPI00279535D9|nr:site-specific DNA-methyltransferase [Massilia sp. REN29]
MAENNIELGYSPDALAERQAKLLALLRQTAPEVISDNQINIEKLKELIGQDHIAPAEHYELLWAGKAAARREIQKATSHTLLPAVSNPPQAPHMLIEGENLEVLRALQKSYHGKVKMIYIDPPYNTGNDSFVYPDDYSETLDEYLKRTGEKNEEGYLNKQSLWKKNTKESGQYHSAWLSMMYPRLYLARNLLCDDGVVFVSIGDDELQNTLLLLDEIFGQENKCATFTWKSRAKPTNAGEAKYRPQKVAEYVLCYAKRNGGSLKFNVTSAKERVYPHKDEKGQYRTTTILTSNRGMFKRETMRFEIAGFRPGDDQRWKAGFDEISKYHSEGRLGFNDEGLPFLRHYEDDESEALYPLYTFVDPDLTGTAESGKSDLNSLIGTNHGFDTVKPVNLLRYLIASSTDTNDIILDFFVGSGTTAQAVMELNLEGGGNRQCICVQMPEALDATSEAFKAGYRTIADITRARIDKVIAKLKAEHPDKTTDLACAQFTLAPSNFKVWRGDVSDAAALRETLDLFQSAEKSGHAPEATDAQTAMLAELLLKHGLGALGVHAISKPVQLAGLTVHRVLMYNDKQLWLCFAPYTSALKDEIVKARPAQVVLLNSCFVGDKADELLSNLQLELAGLDIGLSVI